MTKDRLDPRRPSAHGFRTTRLALWVRKFQFWNVWPMFILANAFVVLSTYVLFMPGSLRPGERVWMASALAVLVLIFIADFVLRLVVAPDRVAFVKQNWMEPVAIVVPPLRPLAVLFYVWRLPLLEEHPKKAMRTRYQMTVAVIAVLLTYAISVWVWRAESHDPHSTIKNWGDSLWWAVSTITTVGYGDTVPITATGRVLGMFLMVGGTLVLGVVSASVITGLSDRWREMTKNHAERVRAERLERRVETGQSRAANSGTDAPREQGVEARKRKSHHDDGNVSSSNA